MVFNLRFLLLCGVLFILRAPPSIASRVPIFESGANWLLVNDFLIKPVTADEVVRFQEWRTPAVIYYARTDIDTLCPGAHAHV